MKKQLQTLLFSICAIFLTAQPHQAYSQKISINTEEGEFIETNHQGNKYITKNSDVIGIWDSSTGVLLDRFTAPEKMIYIGFSRNDSSINLLSKNGNLFTYESEIKKLTKRTGFSTELSDYDLFTYFSNRNNGARSPNGKYYAHFSDYGIILLKNETILTVVDIYKLKPKGRTFDPNELGYCGKRNTYAAHVEWIDENTVSVYTRLGLTIEQPEVCEYKIQSDKMVKQTTARNRYPERKWSTWKPDPRSLQGRLFENNRQKIAHDNSAGTNTESRKTNGRFAKITKAKMVPGTSNIAIEVDLEARSDKSKRISGFVLYNTETQKIIFSKRNTQGFEVTIFGKVAIADEMDISVIDGSTAKQICGTEIGDKEYRHVRLKRRSEKDFEAFDDPAWMSASTDIDLLFISQNLKPKIIELENCREIMGPKDLQIDESLPRSLKFISGTNLAASSEGVYDIKTRKFLGQFPYYDSTGNEASPITSPRYSAHLLGADQGRLIYKDRNRGNVQWWNLTTSNYCRSWLSGTGLACKDRGVIDFNEINLKASGIAGNVIAGDYIKVALLGGLISFDTSSIKIYSRFSDRSPRVIYKPSLPGEIDSVGETDGNLLPIIDSAGVLYLLPTQNTDQGEISTQKNYVQINIDQSLNLVASIPEGYFSISGNIAGGFGIIYGDKTFAIEELWDVFYRPDIVGARLRGLETKSLSGDLTIEKAMRNPPPKVKIAPITSATDARILDIAYSITPDKGGVAEIRVFHNGKLIASDGAYKDARGMGPAKPAASSADTPLPEDSKIKLSIGSLSEKTQRDMKITPKITAFLSEQLIVRSSSEKKCNPCKDHISIDVIPGEENTITVVAFNRDNTIQSVPASISFKSSLPKEDPKLWMIGVGIDKFSDFGSLKNARKDAQDFICSYAGQDSVIHLGISCQEKGKAATLFKPQNIAVTAALLDERGTKDNLLLALEKVAKDSKPQDTFIIFVASHGLMDVNGLFGIVAHDTKCLNTSCTELNGHITSNEILEASKKIKAMKQWVILDTCQSGGLDNKLSGLYDARVSQLAKNMGLHLYASSQSTEAAQDGVPGTNGVFTAQLLFGLNGAASKDQENKITVTTLGDWVLQKTVAATTNTRTARGASRVDLNSSMKRQQRPSQTPVIQHFGKDFGLAF